MFANWSCEHDSRVSFAEQVYLPLFFCLAVGKMSGFQRSFLHINSAALRRTFATEAKTKYPVLEAIVRPPNKIGSRHSRYLRAEKRVPGVIYGSDSDRNVIKQLVTVHQNDLTTQLRKTGMSFENTVYELVIKRELHEGETAPTPVETEKPASTEASSTATATEDSEEGGETKSLKRINVKKVRADVPSVELERILVTPRQIQFNPVSELPVSVNFIKHRPGNRLRVPVEYVNEDASQDLRRGSFLVRVNNFVEVVCDGDVPAKLTVDLSNAKKGDVFRLSTLKLPPMVRPSKRVPLDYVLGVIQSSRS